MDIEDQIPPLLPLQKGGIPPLLLIPLNSAIYSDGKRPLVPIETGHPLSERSDAGVMIFYTILKLSQV